MSSPQSSTPVSVDVSFTKSFETPSIHSPIMYHQDDNNYSAEYQNALIKSDTLLTWNEKLETPTRFVTPERPKLKKSSVVSFK